MSDAAEGPGWWQASDGKWYPPEQHPDAAPATADAPPDAGAVAPPPAAAPPAAPPAMSSAPPQGPPPPGPGYGAAPPPGAAPPYGAAPVGPPPTNNSSSGCLKAFIIVFVILAVLGIGTVVAFVFIIDRTVSTFEGAIEDFERASEEMQGIIDDTGIETSSTNTEYPPQDDVELTGCRISPSTTAGTGTVDVEISGEVVNNSTSASNYFIFVSWDVGGATDATVGISDVSAGQERTWTTSFSGVVDADGDDCPARVSRIERWAVNGPVPIIVPESEFNAGGTGSGN